jgi:hypothetical protein
MRGCGATAGYSALLVGALSVQVSMSLEACASKTPMTLTMPMPHTMPLPTETRKRLSAAFVGRARLHFALEEPW